MGLKISLVGSHGFARGPFNRENHEFCLTKLRESIDLAAAVRCSNVITFTGMREKGIDDQQATKNCVAVETGDRLCRAEEESTFAWSI